MSGTEQRGVCAGGKKPTARSIKQDFETFLKVSKSAQRGEKTFSTRCYIKFKVLYQEDHGVKLVSFHLDHM